MLSVDFLFFFLLQGKTLDQPPLTFGFFSLKTPQRKDGTLPLQPEGAFLCKIMAAMLRDSTVVAAVERTRPRAIPLALITMRKSIHEFPSISITGMLTGLRLAALWAAGAPLLQLISGLLKSYSLLNTKRSYERQGHATFEALCWLFRAMVESRSNGRLT